MDRIVAYLTLINKIVTLCSPLVPVVAFVLRKLKLISQKPAEERNELFEIIALLGFGALGGMIGMFVMLGSAVVIGLMIGMEFYRAASTAQFDPYVGDPGIGLPPLHLDTSSLISGGVSIISTLLIFGGKNKLRGLAFLGGICFGGAIGLMVVASWFLH